MYNLKKQKGTFKGRVGECMAKLVDKYLVVTYFLNKNFYLSRHEDDLTYEQKAFLEKNWYSIDAIKQSWGRRFVIYEIKTKNYYENAPEHWKRSFTRSSVDIYNQALRLGFDVKIMTIHLKDDWDYSLEFEDFETAEYYIDKPKPYDKGWLPDA